jgi:hypothetical protein
MLLIEVGWMSPSLLKKAEEDGSTDLAADPRIVVAVVEIPRLCEE